MVRVRVGIALTATFAAVLALAGCSSSPGVDLDHKCVSAIANYLKISSDSVHITKKIADASGGIDWRGNYPGGKFACGAATDGHKILDAMIYPAGGLTEEVIP